MDNSRRLESDAPLSLSQEQVWLHEQLAGAAASPYRISVGWHLDGPLDAEALGDAVDDVVARHASLRTLFPVLDDGLPVQRITPAMQVDVIETDLTTVPEHGRDAEATRIAVARAQQPFDLERGALVRVHLTRLTVERHLLVITFHHLVIDGPSISIFLRDLARFYEGHVAGTDVALPEVSVQYADYARWQRSKLVSNEFEEALGAWRDVLDEAEPMSLPMDYARPRLATFSGACQVVKLEEEVAERVLGIGPANRATPFMILLSLWSVVLYRWTNRTQLWIGTAFSDRPLDGLDSTIGLFASMAALRADVGGDQSFTDLLAHVRRAVLRLFEYGGLPYAYAVQVLHARARHAPLPSVVFAFDTTEEELALPGVEATLLELPDVRTRFDLEIYCRLRGSVLRSSLFHNTDVLAPATIARLGEAFSTVARRVSVDPSASLVELTAGIDLARRGTVT